MTTSWSRILGSVLFRWACFAAMTVMAVVNEARPGTKIADPILELLPYVPWVDRWNYWLWLGAWIPGTFLLLAVDRTAFVRFMVSGGISSLLRGACILATCLGPVRGADVNAALAWDLDLGLRVVLQILNPLAVLGDQSAHVWLTKDLFFSGHTDSTLLLALYSWRHPRLRALALALHAAVVASVLLGHVHYSIDVLGGWAAALAVFALREGFRSAAARPAVSAAAGP